MNDRDRDAIERIAMYCDRARAAHERHFPTKGQFDEDAFYCDGTAQYIMQIGECVNSLSDGFMREHDAVPWHQIRGMRNIIAHAYGIVDSDEVWNILVEDLPNLRDYCTRLLGE